MISHIGHYPKMAYFQNVFNEFNNHQLHIIFIHTIYIHTIYILYTYYLPGKVGVVGEVDTTKTTYIFCEI